MNVLIIFLWNIFFNDSVLADLYKPGDLIFQEACTEELDNTIKEVTSSAGDYHFTHVGIVWQDKDGGWFVIEATTPEVMITPLQKYLYPEGGNNCYPKSVTGRLKDSYYSLIPQALEYALELVGKKYDYGYIQGNDAYYCSELIYEIFRLANKGEDVFELNTMTFKSSETGEITEGWKKYFEKLNMPVPEGEPGINPGAMSRSNVIDLLDL